MKALTKLRPERGAVLQNDIPIPKIGDGDVLIRVEKVAICGTDLHIYNWNAWAQGGIKPPLIFGHEMSGEVVDVGKGVKRIKVGDMVSAETHIPCGVCHQCLTGNAHICSNMKIVGVDVNGAFAEYVSLPEVVVWKNKEGISPEIAALQEPLGSTFESVMVEDIAGKDVLVLGCGPMGLLAIAVARLGGAANIIATEINDYRRKLAVDMGADYVFDPTEDGVHSNVIEITGGKGVDVVVEMSGNPTALSFGLDVVTAGGRISLVGLFSGNVNMELTSKVIFKGVRLYGITGRKFYSTWVKMGNLLASGRLNVLSRLITHRFGLSDFEKAFDLMNTGNCGKVMLSMV